MAAKGRPIQIVSDSMADLPPEWVKELGVHVVALHVIFQDKSYRDGVDITPREFFDMMRRAPEGQLPRTSHPSPADFLQAYEAVVEATNPQAILSIHASSEISATYQSAVMASRQFDRMPVRVVDSRLVSMAEGLLVREAVRAADSGASVDEVAARLEGLAARIRVRFTVETLEYLWKNGRIGRAQAFVGGVLQVKPILAFEGGMVTPVERVRGRARSLARLVEVCESETGGRGETLVVVHGDVPEEAEGLKEQVLKRCRFGEVVVTPLGPTIGSHTGPGTIGLVYTLAQGQ